MLEIKFKLLPYDWEAAKRHLQPYGTPRPALCQELKAYAV
jgi:hypothetical protein